MQILALFFCFAAFAAGIWHFRARVGVSHSALEWPATAQALPLTLVAILMAGFGLIAQAFFS